METVAIFEQATRKKFRFPFKGVCTVEDLWDLKLTDLDSIFKALNAQVKQSKEESLLAVKSEEDTVLENKIAIVRYIVSVKQAEAVERLAARDRKVQAEKIKALLAKKDDEALESKSTDELKKMLEELEG